MANNVRRYGLGILYVLRQTRTPCSGAQRAPQNRRPVRRKAADPCANPVPPVAAHSVRHKNVDPFATKPRTCAANRHHPDTTAKEEPP